MRCQDITCMPTYLSGCTPYKMVSQYQRKNRSHYNNNLYETNYATCSSVSNYYKTCNTRHHYEKEPVWRDGCFRQDLPNVISLYQITYYSFKGYAQA